MAHSSSPSRPAMPPLPALNAFETIGRHQSLRRAAEELGVSHAALSRHLQALEAWMGQRLVETGPRGTRLTQVGRAYHDTVTRAFATIATATGDFRRAPRRSALTIWCAPGFAARWLAPRLGAIQAALPEADLTLRATDQRPDLAKGEADVEIRYASGPDERWMSAPITDARMFPVASPGWLALRPAITDLSDLVRHPLIHEESRDQWRRWFELAGIKVDGTLDGPRLWDANLALDAAASGQGIALATAPIAADDLASGRLREILTTNIRLGGYWFVSARNRWSDPAIRRLRDWLSEALAAIERPAGAPSGT